MAPKKVFLLNISRFVSYELSEIFVSGWLKCILGLQGTHDGWNCLLSHDDRAKILGPLSGRRHLKGERFYRWRLWNHQCAENHQLSQCEEKLSVLWMRRALFLKSVGFISPKRCHWGSGKKLSTFVKKRALSPQRAGSYSTSKTDVHL